MRKKIIAIAISVVALSILISLGASSTGLFYLNPKFSEKDFDAGETENEDEKEFRWKLVGNISIKIGDVSRLGT